MEITLTAPTLVQLEGLISERVGSAVGIETDTMKLFDFGKRKCIGRVKAERDGFSFKVRMDSDKGG